MIHEDTLAHHRLDDDGAPCPVPPPAPAAPRSFKLGCIVRGEPYQTHHNAIRLATAEECEEYGRDLYSRWTMLQEFRVEPDDEEPNYRMVEGKLFSIRSLEGGEGANA